MTNVKSRYTVQLARRRLRRHGSDIRMDAINHGNDSAWASVVRHPALERLNDTQSTGRIN